MVLARHELFHAALSSEAMRGHELDVEELTISRRGRLIAFGGELDLATSRQVRDRLNGAIDDGVRRMVIDLERTEFLDSTALAAIVGANNRLGGSGRLALVTPGGYVMLVLRAAGLDHVLPCFETREEAVAFVRGAGRRGQPQT